ncbi:DUF547 domain-containing protein [Mesoflavibacter zeaxanthinifaciens]|uniref:DUF547 domain-containing protein n=1 Tax=Mesoflavibacter zeaxanthinifaciens TaxID=393060 RepID=UPI0004163390|nr:DUF547 domain-containing protein [Mesoflavibacter zeaxanthinifaciens]
MKHFIYLFIFSWTFFGFSQDLDHKLWSELLSKHVSESGEVNYKSFKKDSVKLKDYISYLAKNTPSDDATKNEKLAYWINQYNVLTVDLIVRHYPIKSIKDIKNPWKQRLWKTANLSYNLDEIEHDILRKMNEPRIHFAIVCASISCPKLQNKAFKANTLDAQLTKATKEFLADNTKNEITKNQLKLSKIFKWFRKDFETNGSVIDFINQYTLTTISKDAKINYQDYNWNLNE